MLSLTRIKLLSFAAAGALVALTAASASARSEERPVRLGPVGPNEPIITTVGNKNIIAFYAPGDGHCNIQVMMNDRTDAEWRFNGSSSGYSEPSPVSPCRRRR